MEKPVFCVPMVVRLTLGVAMVMASTAALAQDPSIKMLVGLDLVGGPIAAGIGSVGAMLQHAKAGKIHIVAVNGTTRLALMPDVPTYAELGIKGYEEVTFTAVFAPAGIPPELTAHYNAAIVKVVQSADFVGKLAALGITAAAGTPAERAKRVQATHQAWSTMVQNAAYQAQ